MLSLRSLCCLLFFLADLTVRTKNVSLRSFYHLCFYVNCMYVSAVVVALQVLLIRSYTSLALVLVAIWIITLRWMEIMR